MSQTVRAFVAVQVPDEVAEGVQRVQDALQALQPMDQLRWIDPDDAHLTLKFLGDTPIPQLPAIVEALDSVARNWEPFRVTLGPLGAFPDVREPHTIWLGVQEGEKAFQHLYNAVEVALKKLGIRPERRDFHPHLTLARVPRDWPAHEKRAIGNHIGPTELPALPSFTVDAIALMRSLLGPEGATYTRLGNSRFGEAPPLEEDDWEDIPD